MVASCSLTSIVRLIVVLSKQCVFYFSEVYEMINGYLEVSEIAKKWNVTTRRVQIMCAEGQIPGAVKFGRSWAIPEDVEKPIDGRVTTGEYKNWRKSTNKNSE